eukprot:Sspe_Gene.38750::Locus_18698_Transcript_3_4_Confidence_0.583_Length_7921::g.38750::m.38750
MVDGVDVGKSVECAERHAVRILQMLGEKAKRKVVAARFHRLRERLKVEDLMGVVLHGDVEKAGDAIACERWDEAERVVRRILRDIRPLDIDEVHRLVSCTDEATSLLKGAAAVVFVGSSGVGKSTVVHYMAGSEMGEVEHDGIKHYGVVKAAKGTDNVVVGARAVSETRYVTGVKVNPRDLGCRKVKGEVVLVDTPGIADTREVELDIANMVGMVRAISGLKEMWPVLVVSSRCGDRLQMVRETLDTVGAMFPGEIVPFTFLFTKYAKEDSDGRRGLPTVDSIHQTLVTIADNPTEDEEASPHFAKYLEDMIEQTEESRNNPGPLTDHDTVQDLHRAVLGKDGIKDPSGIVSPAFSSRAVKTMNEQLGAMERGVERAVERGEYLLAESWIARAKCLVGMVGLPCVERGLKRVCDRAEKVLETRFTEAGAVLERGVKGGGGAGDMEAYRKVMEKVCDAEGLREMHLGQMCPGVAQYEGRVYQAASYLANGFNGVEWKERCERGKTLRELRGMFKTVQKTWDGVSRDVVNSLEKVAREAKDGLQEGKYRELKGLLGEVREWEAVAEAMGLPGGQHDTLRDAVREKVEGLRDGVKTACARQGEDILDVAQVERGLVQLRALMEVGCVEDMVQKAVCEGEEAVVVWCRALADRAQHHLEKGEGDDGVEGITEVMKQMSEMEGVGLKLDSTYRRVVEAVGRKLRSTAEEAGVLVREGGGESLASLLTAMHGMAWIDGHAPNSYSESTAAVDAELAARVRGAEALVATVSRGRREEIVNAVRLLVHERELMRAIAPVREEASRLLGELQGLVDGVVQRIDERIALLVRQDDHSWEIDWEEADEVWGVVNEVCAVVEEPRLQEARNGVVRAVDQFLRAWEKSFMCGFSSITNSLTQEHTKEAHGWAKTMRLAVGHFTEAGTHAFTTHCTWAAGTLKMWHRMLEERGDEAEGELADLLRGQELERLEWKLRECKLLATACTGPWKDAMPFAALAKDYERRLWDTSGAVHSRVHDALISHDFATVGVEMGQLPRKEGPEYHRLQRRLRTTIQQEVGSALQAAEAVPCNLGRQLVTDQVVKAKGCLERLKDIERWVQGVLPGDGHEALVAGQKEVQRVVEDRVLLCVKKIEKLMQAGLHAEASRQLEDLDNMMSLLGGCATGKMRNAVEELAGQQEERMLRSVEDFKKLGVKDYLSHHPKTFFKELNMGDGLGSRLLCDLRSQVTAQFRNELNNAYYVSPAKADDIILDCQRALTYVPDDMVEDIRALVEAAAEKIKKGLADAHKNIATALQQGDVRMVSRVLSGYDGCDKLLELKKQVETHFTSLQGRVNSLLGDRKPGVVALMGKMKQFESNFDWLPKLHSKAASALLRVVQSFKLQEAVRSGKVGAQEMDGVQLLLEVAKEGGGLPQPIMSEAKQAVKDIRGELQAKHDEIEKCLEGGLTKVDELVHLTQWCAACDKLCPREGVLGDPTGANPTASGGKGLSWALAGWRAEVANRVSKCLSQLQETSLWNNDTTADDATRRAFIDNLSQSIAGALKLELLQDVPVDDGERVVKVCVSRLSKEVSRTTNDVKRYVGTGDIANLQHTCTTYAILRRVEEGLRHPAAKEVTELSTKMADDLQSKWQGEVAALRKEGDIVQALVKLQTYASTLLFLKEAASDAIASKLADFEKARGNEIPWLAVELSKTEKGKLLVDTHRCFEGYLTKVFNEKTQRQDINYVLKRIDSGVMNALSKVCAAIGLPFVPTELRNGHQQVWKSFDYNVKTFLTDPDYTKKLVHQARSKVQPGNNWSWKRRQVIPYLLGDLFSLWALMHADFARKQDADKTAFLFQPHAGQVVALLRMLGYDLKGSNKLYPHMLQVGTGEGKSVILAVASCVLALHGMAVNCVCYSKHLSQRDYDTFRPLFEAVGVTDMVWYGTFNEACEREVNRRVPVRESVEGLIRGQDVRHKTGEVQQRTSVLLVDEVDVFFNDDFYGSLYRPLCPVSAPCVGNLLRWVWGHRKQKDLVEAATQCEAYAQCTKAFHGWEELVEEGVKVMVAAAKAMESHEYTVCDGRIGYKEQDGVDFNVRCGYLTCFAALAEEEKGAVQKEEVDRHLALGVGCGEMAYAELPKLYSTILGVTGTLNTLTQQQREDLEQVYGVRYTTEIPSVFGKNQLQFAEREDVAVEQPEDHLNTVGKIVADNAEAGRAVIVFFENRKKLEEFRQHPTSYNFRHRMNVLVEGVSAAEREMLVQSASSSGQVTLAVRSFGRGTDFVCRDPKVAAAKGVLVVQTFFSDEESEEVQIKGRTARQGEVGGYRLVLREDELERFGVQRSDLTEWQKGKDVYKKLTEKRREIGEARRAGDKQFVEQRKQQHTETLAFLKDLEEGKGDKAKAFLLQRNKAPRGVVRSRTMVLLDGTGSMSTAMQKCKNTVHTMFERAVEILNEHFAGGGAIEMQYAIYRNYNAPVELLLQHSHWSTDPNVLRDFLEKVHAGYGMGNEAVEVGLQHAREAEGVTQVILIGDRPPNTAVEVAQRRGTNLVNTRFESPTTWSKEIEHFSDHGIPVHAFYLRNRAKEVFGEIASRTGGRCAALDIESDTGTKMLVHVVTEELLRNSGGEQLVQTYKQRYGGS